MKLNDVLALIRCNSLHLDNALAYAGEKRVELLDLIDGFAELIAQRYLSGEWDYALADSTMNGLFNFATSFEVLHVVGHEVRVFLLSVYTAFDQGEYHHPGDSEDLVPHVRYTKPMLILALDSRHA